MLSNRIPASPDDGPQCLKTSFFSHRCLDGPHCRIGCGGADCLGVLFTVNKSETYTLCPVLDLSGPADNLTWGVCVCFGFGAPERDPMAKRILIADDSAFMRKQIRTILELESDMEVCAEAANGLEAVQKVRNVFQTWLS
jgi:nitrogenase subunit NifH